MMAQNSSIPRRWRQWASGLLLIVAGCAEPTATAQVPGPIPAGQARVWFYRPYEPSESLNLALIDVPPGHYHIAPES
jgi:hypothetical protein